MIIKSVSRQTARRVRLQNIPGLAERNKTPSRMSLLRGHTIISLSTTMPNVVSVGDVPLSSKAVHCGADVTEI